MVSQLIHLVKDKELTPHQMFLILWLFRDGKEVTESLPEIAKSANMKKPSVSKILNMLARKNVITIKQNYSTDGGRSANTYKFVL